MKEMYAASKKNEQLAHYLAELSGKFGWSRRDNPFDQYTATDFVVAVLGTAAAAYRGRDYRFIPDKRKEAVVVTSCDNCNRLVFQGEEYHTNEENTFGWCSDCNSLMTK
jgi:hypothetical protein